MSTCIRWIKIDVMETCSVFVFGVYIHYGVAGSRTRLDRRLHTPSALAFCIHIYYGDAFCIYISVMPFVYITVTLVVVHDLVVAWTRRVRIHAHGLQVYL